MSDKSVDRIVITRAEFESLSYLSIVALIYERGIELCEPYKLFLSHGPGGLVVTDTSELERLRDENQYLRDAIREISGLVEGAHANMLYHHGVLSKTKPR